MSRQRLLVLLLAVCTATAVGCETGGLVEPPRPQTRILDVRVDPNPIPTGDTATFTAIIEDSLDATFRFTWLIRGQGPAETAENTLRWPAEVAPDTYTAAVIADNGDFERYAPSKGFVFVVVE